MDLTLEINTANNRLATSPFLTFFYLKGYLAILLLERQHMFTEYMGERLSPSNQRGIVIREMEYISGTNSC